MWQKMVLQNGVEKILKEIKCDIKNDENSLIDEITAYQDGIIFDGWWCKRNVLHSNYLR